MFQVWLQQKVCVWHKEITIYQMETGSSDSQVKFSLFTHADISSRTAPWLWTPWVTWRGTSWSSLIMTSQTRCEIFVLVWDFCYLSKRLTDNFPCPSGYSHLYLSAKEQTDRTIVDRSQSNFGFANHERFTFPRCSSSSVEWQSWKRSQRLRWSSMRGCARRTFSWCIGPMPWRSSWRSRSYMLTSNYSKRAAVKRRLWSSWRGRGAWSWKTCRPGKQKTR